jgi:hypothetical protein
MDAGACKEVSRGDDRGKAVDHRYALTLNHPLLCFSGKKLPTDSVDKPVDSWRGKFRMLRKNAKNIGGGHKLCNPDSCAQADPFGLDTMDKQAGSLDLGSGYCSGSGYFHVPVWESSR